MNVIHLKYADQRDLSKPSFKNSVKSAADPPPQLHRLTIPQGTNLSKMQPTKITSDPPTPEQSKQPRLLPSASI